MELVLFAGKVGRLTRMGEESVEILLERKPRGPSDRPKPISIWCFKREARWALKHATPGSKVIAKCDLEVGDAGELKLIATELG